MLDLAKSKALGRPTCSRNVASASAINPTSLEIPICWRSDRAGLTHASANFKKQWAAVTINIFEQRISASNQRDLITTMGVYNIRASAMHITFKHAAAVDCPPSTTSNCKRLQRAIKRSPSQPGCWTRSSSSWQKEATGCPRGSMQVGP